MSTTSESDSTIVILDAPVEQAILVERTLAIVKPDAVNRYDEIEDFILQNGFTILQKRRVWLTAEQASDFYAEHFGQLFFTKLIVYMTSGPIMALMLAKVNAVADWNALLGSANYEMAKKLYPNCLRAVYGTDADKNGLHGSAHVSDAQREIGFFFNDAIVEPLVDGQSAKDYLARAVNPTLLKGLTGLCKTKPENPEIWLSDWLLANNPYSAKIKETPAVTVKEL